MKIAVLAVTEKGAGLGAKLTGFLKDAGHQAHLYTVPGVSAKLEGVTRLEGPLSGEMGGLFRAYRGIVMIMALGIVVRIIAPHMDNKRKDPAVVAMDDGGNFAISVLSGHAGGANDLARLIAGLTGARAVITTATDVAGAPAVDVLARDYKLEPERAEAVKRINAALARGERVRVYSEYKLPLEDRAWEQHPWESLQGERAGKRVIVTGRTDVTAGEEDILLRPRNLVAGVGCKKGVDRAVILGEIKRALATAGRSVLCLRALATIDLKAGEKGLLEAAGDLGLPLLTFDSVEINRAMEELALQKSVYVNSTMGVGGVCEPAAMLACRKGVLLAGKIKGPGVTVALAEEKSGWWE
jgi:cobalt-precorrin 5A hydrolase